MKTSKEQFVEMLRDEIPRFIKVFEALPNDKLDWKPDPKSRSAMEMVVGMAYEASLFDAMLTTGIVNFGGGRPEFSSLAEAIAAFQQVTKQAADLVDSTSNADWDSGAKFVMGEDTGGEWTTTRGGLTWGFLFDMIHHRGQLATYIRPMGGKVPAIYGPSADSEM